MSDSIISVLNVRKSFGSGENKNEVLKDISFEIGRGEFVSIMGPSGCGKSTLLYLIGGLDRPDSGSIEVCSKDISTLNDKEISKMRRNDMGFIFQFYNLVPNLTVEENIYIPAIMDGVNTSSLKKRFDEIIGVVGLENKLKSFPTELSGGQQQRVAIARALIMHPKVILADEPTGNLDRKSGGDVMELFRTLNEQLDITVLQVTHSEEMASFGKRTIYLCDGLVENDVML